jgi:type I restriction enzyme, R subunit
LAATQAQLKVAQGDQAVWEQMASEAEQAKAAIAAKLAQMQAAASAQSQAQVKTFVAASTQASKNVELDEADTRVIIDEQLRSVGWDADTINLRYSKGSRPAKGKNQAIAEWPTETGPADYVLFAGLVPVATVEAKRKNKDVSAFLKQAKRYSAVRMFGLQRRARRAAGGLSMGWRGAIEDGEVGLGVAAPPEQEPIRPR